jgi:hypothetical protein
MLPLALLLAACGHKAADAAPPAPPEPVAAPEPAAPEEPAPAEPADAAPADPNAAQQVTFADDADPEPTTMVQSAPKRPPIPRFKLFGTRETDGPN